MQDLDSNLLSNSGLNWEQPGYSFQNMSILEVSQQNTQRKSRD